MPAAEAVAHVKTLAVNAGLRIVTTGEWPDGGETELPGVAGFILSSFSPLIVEAVRRAMTAQGFTPSVASEDPSRTAVILLSTYGDMVSARAVAQAVDEGLHVGPLMFFQAVPNSVAGYVAVQWGFTGPIVAISPAGDPYAEGVEVADLLIADGDADRALLVFVEQADEGEGEDRSLAVLVERSRELGR